MTAPSTPRLLDPLGTQHPAPLEVKASAGVARRRERVAPEVAKMDGAEAVSVVRAGGFVAAIESVPSELPAGTVIEQEPPAGVVLEREAVVTLRLATPLFDVARAEAEAEREPASEGVPGKAGPDDTEEWFEALALTEREAGRGRASTRRSRKHRRSRPPAHELVFDPAPAATVELGGPARASMALGGARGQLNVWPLIASANYAFPATLTGLPWRRATAVVAGLLLLALLGMRLFASNDRRAQATDHRALPRTTYAQVTARESIRPSRTDGPGRPSRAPRKKGTGHTRLRRTSHHARARTPDKAPVAPIVARSANESRAAAVPAAMAPPPARGQFAYLGE